MVSAAVPCRRVYLVGLGDLSDDLPGGRVDGGEHFPTDGVLPFVVDEELEKNNKQKQLVGTQPGKRGLGGEEKGGGAAPGKRSQS